MRKIGVELVPSYNHRPAFSQSSIAASAKMFARLGGRLSDAKFSSIILRPNSSPVPITALRQQCEFDKIYEKARIMNDSPERTALYARMADIVIKNCPWILWTIRSTTAVPLLAR